MRIECCKLYWDAWLRRLHLGQSIAIISVRQYFHQRMQLSRCTCTNLHTKTDSIFQDRIAIHFVTTRHLDYGTGINDLGSGRTSAGLGTKVGYAPAIFRIAVNDLPISIAERLIQERVGEVVRTLSCSAEVAA